MSTPRTAIEGSVAARDRKAIVPIASLLTSMGYDVMCTSGTGQALTAQGIKVSLVRKIHEEHGVQFRLGTTAVSIDEKNVTLKTGERLAADLVVLGIGAFGSLFDQPVLEHSFNRAVQRPSA